MDRGDDGLIFITLSPLPKNNQSSLKWAVLVQQKIPLGLMIRMSFDVTCFVVFGVVALLYVTIGLSRLGHDAGEIRNYRFVHSAPSAPPLHAGVADRMVVSFCG